MADDSPVILVLPGGGYSYLAEHEGEPVAQWLRGLGWRARVVEYPVLTRHPGPLAVVQAAIAEERRAGAAQVGIIGFSAGGHLAGLSALIPDAAADARPDFAILAYPVVSMVTETHKGSRENLVGLDASDELRRSVSLELLVTPQAPHFFIWTTTDDASVPIAEHTYPLGAALAGARVGHDFHVFDNGGGHGMGLAPGSITGDAWTGLAALWLAKRAT